MATKVALGADMCNAARAMMFALGCIQALRCNTNQLSRPASPRRTRSWCAACTSTTRRRASRATTRDGQELLRSARRRRPAASRRPQAVVHHEARRRRARSGATTSCIRPSPPAHCSTGPVRSAATWRTPGGWRGRIGSDPRSRLVISEVGIAAVGGAIDDRGTSRIASPCIAPGAGEPGPPFVSSVSRIRVVGWRAALSGAKLGSPPAGACGEPVVGLVGRSRTVAVRVAPGIPVAPSGADALGGRDRLAGHRDRGSRWNLPHCRRALLAAAPRTASRGTRRFRALHAARGRAFLEYQQIRSATGIPRLAAYRFEPLTLVAGDRASSVWADFVSGNYFGVVGVHPLLGRPITQADERIPGHRWRLSHTTTGSTSLAAVWTYWAPGSAPVDGPSRSSASCPEGTRGSTSPASSRSRCP